MKCGAENTVQNAEERVIIKTKFVEKQIEKITYAIFFIDFIYLCISNNTKDLWQQIYSVAMFG